MNRLRAYARAVKRKYRWCDLCVVILATAKEGTDMESRLFTAVLVAALFYKGLAP